MERTPSSSGCTNFVILDFEASGLDAGGWPIEIGLSGIGEDGAVGTWSSLIRPDLGWSMTVGSEPTTN